MLQGMRDLAKSWIFKGLMVLLILSFGIWGIGDMFRGNPMTRVVGSVGNVDITVQMLEQAFQQELPKARQIFGADFTAAQARQIGFLDRTLGTMLERALFDQEVARLGLKVGEDPILKKVASLPDLRKEDGSFDVDKFHQILRQSGMTEQSFLSMERQDSARRILLEALISGGIAPKIMTDYIYKARGQKRILEVVTIDDASMKNLKEASEEELKAFHEKNAALFTSPERRSLSLASLPKEDIGKDITVTDEELKQAYEEQAESFKRPEVRDFIQILASDEDQAKKLAEEATQTKNLKSVAETNKLKISPLKGITAGSLPAVMKDVLFALKENGVSTPIKSDLGWHVVQLLKITPEGVYTFDDVKEDLKAHLIQEKTINAVSNVLNDLNDSLAAGMELEEIANSLKLRLTKIQPIDVIGEPESGKIEEKIPAQEKTLRQVFLLNEGEVSEVMEDENQNYFVVRTDTITPSHLRSFDEVKKDVADNFRAEQQREKASAEAKEIAEALRDGKKATSFTTRAGTSVRLSKPISNLGAWDQKLPKNLMPEVLKMSLNDVITGHDAEKQYVLRLTDIVEADPKEKELDFITLEKKMKQTVPFELIEIYSTFLKKRYPVSINPSTLNTMKNQGN